MNTYWGDYFGQIEFRKYGELVRDNCKGMIISKKISDAEKPGGLIYESKRLSLPDLYTLLRTLEGMCYNGWAEEIDDSHYKVL